MSTERAVRALGRSYDTVRYGRVHEFVDEVLIDGVLYHAVGNSGNAHYVREDGGIDAIPLSVIPPAPFAPDDFSDTEARCLHYLEWGRREWLAQRATERPGELKYSIQNARLMAQGEIISPRNTYRPGIGSIWWHAVIRDLTIAPERVYP